MAVTGIVLSNCAVDMDVDFSALKLMEITDIDFTKLDKCSLECDDFWDRYWSLDIDILFRGL